MGETTALSPMQYITEENGKRVGVVLSWDDYKKIQGSISDDPDQLSGLSRAELEALAYSELSLQRQERMTKLLRKNSESALSEDERKELAQLTDQIDQLNILKARALLTLRQQSRDK